MKNNKPFLTLPLRLKLMWLMVATKQGRAFARYAFGGASRAKNGKSVSEEEWLEAAKPFLEVLQRKGFNVEEIIDGFRNLN